MKNCAFLFVFVIIWVSGTSRAFSFPELPSDFVNVPLNSVHQTETYMAMETEEKFLKRYYDRVFRVSEFIKEQRFEQVFSMYRSVLKQIVYETDPCELFINHGIVSQLNYEQHLYDAYIESLNSAYGYIQECKLMKTGTKRYFQMGLLNNLSHVYNLMEDPNAALGIYEKAEKVMQSWNQLDEATERNDVIRLSQAVFDMNMAESYYQLNKFEIAEPLWKKTEKLLEENGGEEERLLASAKIGLSAIYVDRQQPALALKMLIKAEEYYLTSPDEVLYQKLSNGYRLYYENRGDIERAYEYFKLTTASKQALQNRAETLRTFNTKSEIAYLENEIESARLVQQSNIRFVVSVISISVLCIVLFLLCFVWYRKNILYRDYENLRFSTKVILKQNSDLNRAVYNIRNQLSLFSHDIQNIITGLTFASSQIIESDDVSGKPKNFARMVAQSLTEFGKLVKSSVESTTQYKLESSDFRSVNCKKLLDNLKHILVPILAEKNQSLVVNSTDNLQLQTDENKIIRILINLIENASKFSPKDSSIWVSTHVKDNAVIFLIEDQGPGISESVRKNLFESGVFEANRYSSEKSSSGLGLYIARIFAKDLSGTVQLSNSKSKKKGACFEVVIPV